MDLVSVGEETKRETKTTQQVPVVVPITTETADGLLCVYGTDPAAANYTWYRQDLLSLPEGTKAEGNRLHFMTSTSDLNGMYVCIITNKYGTFAAQLYRKIHDCPLQRISKWGKVIIFLKFKYI